MYNKGKSRLKEIEQALSNLHAEVHGGSPGNRILESYFASASQVRSQNKLHRGVVSTTQTVKKKVLPKSSLATSPPAASALAGQVSSSLRNGSNGEAQITTATGLEGGDAFQPGVEDFGNVQKVLNRGLNELDQSPEAEKRQTDEAIHDAGTHIDACVQEGVELYTKLCDAIQDYREVDDNDQEGGQGSHPFSPDAPPSWAFVSAGVLPAHDRAFGDAAWLEPSAQVTAESREGAASHAPPGGDHLDDEDGPASAGKGDGGNGSFSDLSGPSRLKGQLSSSVSCAAPSSRAFTHRGPSLARGWAASVPMAREGTAVAVSLGGAYAKKVQREVAAARQRRQCMANEASCDAMDTAGPHPAQADPPAVRREWAPRPSSTITRLTSILFCQHCHRGFEFDVSHGSVTKEGDASTSTTACPYCSTATEMPENLLRWLPSSKRKVSPAKPPMRGVECGCGDGEVNGDDETTSASLSKKHEMALSESVGTDLTGTWSESLKGLYFLHLWDEATRIQT